MIKKFFYLLNILAIFFNIQSVSSQESFVEGTINTKDNQTINALLDANTCKTNTDKICYKTFGSDSLKYLRVTEVLSFTLNNQTFESANIIFDPEIRSYAAESEKDYMPKAHSVFVLPVVKGNVSLYVYYDKNNNEYFFFKEDENFTFLVCYDYYVIDETTGTKTLKRNESFKKQLLNLFIENPNLASKIKDTEYSLNAPGGIKRLFELSNQEEVFQKMESIDITNVRKAGKFQFALKAGATIEKLDHDYDDFCNPYYIYFKPDFTYSLGFSIGYAFPYFKRKPSIHIYCERTPFSFSEESIYKNRLNNIDTTKRNYSGVSYSIQAVINSTIKTKGNSEWYYFIGLGYNHAILKENIVTTYFHGNYQDKTYNYHLISRHPYLVLSGGLGYSYKHLFVEARLKTTSNTKKIPSPLYFDPILSATCFVGFRF